MSSLADRRSIEAFLIAHEDLVEPTLYEMGRCVDSWRIMAFLGRGGSGEVYRVEHQQLGVAAAMKVLTRDDAHAQDRFRREAALFASSAHPAFPRFLGYGETDGRPYLVLELLADFRLPSSDRSVARYLCKVCEGVSHLHSIGLVHRDIKPANILCREKDGQPVLIDLGLVKDTALPTVHKGESLSLVNGKAVGVGTPKYAAPEQFSGGTISPSADVHALGMLANECFGGNPPRSWARIIRRSTSSIPAQRYKTVEEFAGAIRKRHMGRVVVVATALVLLLALATAAQIGWLSAIAGRAHVDVSSRRVTEGDDHLIKEAIAKPLSSWEARTPPLRVGVPPHQNRGFATTSKTRRGAASTESADTANKLFMVTDDETSSERTMKKRITYPQAGVFGGNGKIDPNF